MAKAETTIIEREQRGIQSVEVGGQLLLALAHSGRPMALKDLAREAGMVPAKAHPYLVSYGKLGLITQDPASGRYGLGPLAMQLGLISLQQFDPVRLATSLLADLGLRMRHTVGIAVWGNRGATIVRVEEAPSEVHVNMRHGTVMSTRSTASGRVFAAYLPPDIVATSLKQEDALAAMSPRGDVLVAPPGDRAFKAELALVRRHRLSHSVDAVVPGVSAIAAPVFDMSGAIVLSLIAIGPSAIFNADFDSPLAMTLRACAEDLSKQLGAPPPT
jgi:DNA-binding IclR family transcriptional regulator